MNTALTKIASLTHKPRNIIGLMSGTSLDGLDIALCEVSGHGLATSLQVKRFTSIHYSTDFLSKIRPLFANPKASLSDVTHANVWIAREHASMVINTLAKWDMSSSEVDILASHGQTIFHAPNSFTLPQTTENVTLQKQASATLQIGDGDHLASLTQIITVSDFRQKHVAAGGEGAPLVPYADYLLFSSLNENRILVNIGGIANFTFMPMNSSFKKVVSADSGPGNTLMDAVIKCTNDLTENGSLVEHLPRVEKLYDANGDLASKGNIDELLLNIMLAAVTNDALNHDEKIVANKSTGQETYNINFVYKALVKRLPKSQKSQSSSPLVDYLSGSEQAFYDLIATLNLFTAKTIGIAIERLHISLDELKKSAIYLSGGGVHNSILVANIQKCVAHIPVKLCSDLGINADAKEAALFAVLANQTLFGNSAVFANSNKIPATSFGKISLP